MIELVALALVAGLAAAHALAAHRREISFEQERRDWRIERAELLNRIKPETYQAPARQIAEPETPVDLTSDDAYWEARGIRNPAPEVDGEPITEEHEVIPWRP